MEKNISICMLLPLFPPDYSGAGNQALRLSIRLIRHGIGVFVITYRNSGLPIFDKVQNIRVIRLPVFGPELVKTILFNLQCLPLLLMKMRNYKIIHLHSLNGLYCATFMRWFFRKRVIYKMTNCGMDDPLSLKRQPGGSLKFKLFSAVDRAIAISRDCQQAYEKSDLPPEKCCLIPNGVDIQKFKPLNAAQKIALRKKLDIAPEKLVVTFSGNVNPAKGIHKLVPVLKQLVPIFPDIECVILGPILDDAYYQEVRNSIEKSGLSRKFRFTGKIDNVHQYLQASDIFAFPSDGEGMPNALLEAMATGLPCVATRVSGCKDLISHEENGFLFAPDDLPELTARLKALLSQPALRIRIGGKARDSVARCYSMQVISGKYKLLYVQVLSDRKRPE